MSVCYHSTRSNTNVVSPTEALLLGIAPDGGLFITDDLCTIDIPQEKLLASDLKDCAHTVLAALLPDIDDTALTTCIAGAYGKQWDTPQICPVTSLGEDFLLELYHGPTCAFKDVALQMLPRLINAAQKDTGPDLMIVTATSGDTGKAALEGFRDVAHTGVCVFYPYGNVSDIQRLQMVTQKGSNVAVSAIKGNFDDAQTEVKHIFADKALSERLAQKNIALSSANSINIGRLIPQIAYYVSSYTKLLERGVISLGNDVEFIVPTGNFGDVLAGYFAKRLGLPISRLIVASNKNRILTDFLSTGIYDTKRPFYTTISPSMDILVSSNLERLIYYASGSDPEYVASLMKSLSETGQFSVSKKVLQTIQTDFACGYATDEEASACIKNTWDDYGVLIDPHTAVAVHVMNTFTKTDTARICLSTANAYKFSSDVLKALGAYTEGDDDFCALAKLQRLTGIPAPFALTELKNAQERHTSVVDIADMEAFVEVCSERIFS